MKAIELIESVSRKLPLCLGVYNFAAWNFFSFTAPMAINQNVRDNSENLDPLYQRLFHENPEFRTIYGFDSPTDWAVKADQTAAAIAEMYFSAWEAFVPERDILSLKWDTPRSPSAIAKSYMAWAQKRVQSSTEVDAVMDSLFASGHVMESEAPVRDYTAEALDVIDESLGMLEASIPVELAARFAGSVFSLKDNDTPREHPEIPETGWTPNSAIEFLLEQTSDAFDPVEAVANRMLSGEIMGMSGLRTVMRMKPALAQQYSGLLFERKRDALALIQLGAEPEFKFKSTLTPTQAFAQNVIWPSLKAEAEA